MDDVGNILGNVISAERMMKTNPRVLVHQVVQLLARIFHELGQEQMPVLLVWVDANLEWLCETFQIGQLEEARELRNGN